jgi:hypothetical protein
MYKLDNLNITIGNYVKNDNLNITIGNYLKTDNFNTTIGNYLKTDNFNTTIGNYLKTSDFNLTQTSLVSTNTIQDIVEQKRFLKPISVRCGGSSIRISPEFNTIGEASIQYNRNSDGSYPVLGDFWRSGLDISSGRALHREELFLLVRW